MKIIESCLHLINFMYVIILDFISLHINLFHLLFIYRFDCLLAYLFYLNDLVRKWIKSLPLNTSHTPSQARIKNCASLLSSVEAMKGSEDLKGIIIKIDKKRKEKKREWVEKEIVWKKWQINKSSSSH